MGHTRIFILVLYVYILFMALAGLKGWREITNWFRFEDDRNIQRFLQWAELDIEEAQRLKDQRLRVEMPTPHKPSR